MTGRANVGKSTLLNAVVNRKDLMITGKTPVRTHFTDVRSQVKCLSHWLWCFRVVRKPSISSASAQSLVTSSSSTHPGMDLVADLNGVHFSTTTFRTALRTSDVFSTLLATSSIQCSLPFTCYSLRRVYILFHAKHGLNESDRLILSDLDQQVQRSGGTTWTLQAVVTKADMLLSSSKVRGEKSDEDAQQWLSKLRKDIFEAAPTCLPPIVTTAQKAPFFGIDELRRNMLDACGI